MLESCLVSMTKQNRIKKGNLIVTPNDVLIIDCYRVKIEFIEPHVLRIYTFNSINKGGDNAVEVNGDIWTLDIYSEAEHPQHFSITNPKINPSRRDERAYRREDENGERKEETN